MGPAVKFKIYKCYEIVILDAEDNQVKESDYCYGTRKDAEEMAKHELKIQMMHDDDSSGPRFKVGCRYTSTVLRPIEIVKRNGEWVWFRVDGVSKVLRRKIYNWGNECEMIRVNADCPPGYDWFATDKEEGC